MRQSLLRSILRIFGSELKLILKYNKTNFNLANQKPVTKRGISVSSLILTHLSADKQNCKPL